MSELKPCPFCGASAILREERESDGHESFSYYVVRCTGCKAHTNAFITGGFYGEQHTEQDAIAAWNRRTDDEAD